MNNFPFNLLKASSVFFAIYAQFAKFNLTVFELIIEP